MANDSYERQLEELAFGEDWSIAHLTKLTGAVAKIQERLGAVVAELKDKWHGGAAELALARFETHQRNMAELRRGLNEVQLSITGMSEDGCSASCANSVRKTEAQRLLQALPSGAVPQWAHDAVNRGLTVDIPVFGKLDLNSGLEDFSEFLGADRNSKAYEALVELQGIVDGEKKKLQEVKFQFDDIPGPVGPIKVPNYPEDGDQNDSGGDGPTPGVTPPGVGVRPPVGQPGGGGDHGTGGPGGDGPGVNQNPPVYPDPNNPDWPVERDPDWPTVVTDPPVYDPNDPDGPGGNSGVDPEWNNPDRRPSVDSDLDGSTVRSGLGAAGLGAAGLAAGAKLAGAGGRGGAVGLGGVGQGAFGAGGAGLSGGGGLRGAASAAPSGGAAGTGSSSSNGGGRAGRGGMMMGGGGGGGGAAEKKSARSGLGYIAPKLEDEGDGGPAARASRAGGRLPEE